MKNSEYVLGGTTTEYLGSEGSDLLDRLQSLTDWLDSRYEHGIDPYSKSSDGFILAERKAQDRLGRTPVGEMDRKALPITGIWNN